jgi:hypothetical protein
MNEAEKQHPLHVLCSACGHMGCEHLAHELEQLRAAARAVLATSELGVSEAEGVRRLQALAKIIGYATAPQPPATGLPEDANEAAREAWRIARLLSEEIEAPGSSWAFALFLYRDEKDGRPGSVIQVSRDRERTWPAVARWLKDVMDSKDTKARG